ncbi:MAG: hypothetical protein AB1403_20095 [Candidatus Riflebacteria bacterium]
MNRVRITLLLSVILLAAAYFLLKNTSVENKQDSIFKGNVAEKAVEPAKKIELAEIQPATLSIKVEQLVESQWFRIARLKLEKELSSTPDDIVRQIALALGDSRLFWHSMPQNVSAAAYWQQNVHSTLHPEKIWNFVRDWPSDDHNVLRQLVFFAEFLRRPLKEKSSVFNRDLVRVFPKWLKRFELNVAFQGSLNSFADLRIIPVFLAFANADSPMLKAASLQNWGWSWSELAVLVEVSPGFKPAAAQWFVESGQAEQAMNLVPVSSTGLFTRELEDAALAFSGSPPDWRNRAMVSMQNWFNELPMKMLAGKEKDSALTETLRAFSRNEWLNNLQPR